MGGVISTATLTVRLYTHSGAPFPAGGPGILIASTPVIVGPGQNGTIVTVPLNAIVPPGTAELVMELYTPDGAANHMVFAVGGNDAPETGPSYWSAPISVGSCSAPQVINTHLVFNVYGSCVTQATNCRTCQR